MRSPLAIRRFSSAIRGSVAVEFAFAMPALMVLVMLGVQVISYVNAVRKVELLASSMSQMLSQKVPPQGSSTATVNYQDLHFAYDSGLVVFPYLMADAKRQGLAWWQDINIDYASVQFTQILNKTCPVGGDQSTCYLASVVWTSNGTTGTNYRACLIPQLPMNDTAVPNKLTLPRSIFGPGSVIVVDIVFTYHPAFAGNLMPAMRIARSVYVQPRYAALIDYNTTNSDGIASKC